MESQENHKSLNNLTKIFVTALKNSNIVWNHEQHRAKHVAQLKLQCF